MKNYLAKITMFLLLFDFSTAQSLFVNAIEFKGKSEKNYFKGLGFDIKFDEGKFLISQHRNVCGNFVIKRSDDSMQDLVFSANRSVIAVAMRATDSKSRRRVMVTISADGKQRSFEYEAYKMTERLGWVVELGAVSNDGDYVLAKCALMLPENEAGVSHVRHEWTVLKMSDTAINVINSVDAIDKWHDYAHTGQ
jgi:hypothetical protein